MKKLISILTSAVMTICTLSVFFNAVPDICYADDKTLLTAGNIELSEQCDTKVEVREDSVYIGMFDEILYVTTSDDFSCRWVDEDGYYFTPDKNGKYQLFFPCGGTWADIECCMYNIECHDNIVDIRFNYSMIISISDGSRNVSITTADGKSAQYEKRNIPECLPFYNSHLFFDKDYWFFYTIDRDEGTSCHSLYMPIYNKGDIIVSNDYTFIDFSISDYDYTIEELLPEKANVPQSLYLVGIGYFYPMTGIEIHEYIDINLIRTNGYDTSYISLTTRNDLIIPSTLNIVKGTDYDINLDRQFNIADVVKLQRYLLGDQFDYRFNWRAADICRDGVIDVFDVVAMRKALIAASF